MPLPDSALPAATVSRVNPLGLIVTVASAMTDPDKPGSQTGLLVAVVAIVAIVGLCLWLFFRRGSINDRAEIDVPLVVEPAPTESTPTAEPTEPPSVGGPGDEADRSPR